MSEAESELQPTKGVGNSELTPETDAASFYARQVFRDLERVVPLELARKLERQRNMMLRSLMTLRDAPWLNLSGRAGELIESTIAAVKGEQP